MLTFNDVAEWLGSDRYTDYIAYQSAGQRMGQAFMNVLDENDYHTLTGSLVDPFYKDTPESVLNALAYLLEK